VVHDHALTFWLGRASTVGESGITRRCSGLTRSLERTRAGEFTSGLWTRPALFPVSTVSGKGDREPGKAASLPAVPVPELRPLPVKVFRPGDRRGNPFGGQGCKTDSSGFVKIKSNSHIIRARRMAQVFPWSRAGSEKFDPFCTERVGKSVIAFSVWFPCFLASDLFRR
jgi:hypothetical protein